MKKLIALCLAAVCGLSLAVAADKEDEGFKTIFDGKSFDGWKINENKDSWALEDGAFKAMGERSHLFYVGDDKPFVNFELKVDCKTSKGSNGGVYFHTKFQETGWPKYGYETQVNNTHGDWRKTGSLYAVEDVKESAAQDDKWWTQHIIVKGKHIIVKIDGKTVVDYTEPEGKEPGKDFTRVVDKGTFALQAHDPKSVVWFKNIRVKRLD
jgi:hypothetical protein